MKWDTERYRLTLLNCEDRFGCKLVLGRKDGADICASMTIHVDAIPELISLLEAAR